MLVSMCSAVALCGFRNIKRSESCFGEFLSLTTLSSCLQSNQLNSSFRFQETQHQIPQQLSFASFKNVVIMLSAPNNTKC